MDKNLMKKLKVVEEDVYFVSVCDEDASMKVMAFTTRPEAEEWMATMKAEGFGKAIVSTVDLLVRDELYVKRITSIERAIDDMKKTRRKMWRDSAIILAGWLLLVVGSNIAIKWL